MLWKITPPHNVYYRRELDGQRTYLRTEALATSMDIKFTFAASGQVKSEAPHPDTKTEQEGCPRIGANDRE